MNLKNATTEALTAELDDRQVLAERLRELYALVDGVPSVRFSMSSWRRNPYGKQRYRVGYVTAVSDEALLTDKDSCGCAVGWACAYPPFIAQGLSFGGLDSKSPPTQPWFDDLAGIEAAVKFFGLSSGEGYNLFYDVRHIGQKTRFLDRLRSLMMEKGVITPARSEELALMPVT